jgi:hypothetical protein
MRSPPTLDFPIHFRELTMTNLFRFAVTLAALLLTTACASTTGPTAEAAPERIYRTGSNIPAKDYGGANVEVASPEVINPVNRPMPNVMNKKPGG